MPYKRGNPLGGAHYRDRGACSKGHMYVDGSWRWSPLSSMGYRTRICRICEAERTRTTRSARSPEQKKQQNRDRTLARARARLSPEEFKAWEAEIVAKWQKDQQRASNPMNALAIKGDAQEALDGLNKSMEAQRTNCFERPGDFMDFDDPRYPDEWDADNLKPAPDRETRQLMCADCPVFALCENYAEVAKPDFGVYAGELYIGGKKA